MKKNLLLIISVLGFGLLWGQQPYGNEWINTSRTHYKIKVAQDGIYRISYQTLQNAGMPVSTIFAANLVMFHNGQAVPIYISTPNSIMGPNDYIEFYGERNNGYIDSLLYRSAEDQINPAYSLFTDTSVYFLTTNNQTNNPRFTVEANVLVNLPPKESYFSYTVSTRLTNQYYAGKYISSGSTEIYRCSYDKGEGYAGLFYGGTNPRSFTLTTPSVNTAGGPASLTTYFANHSASEGHQTSISLNGNQIFQQSNVQIGFRFNRETISINAAQLNSGGNTFLFQENVLNNNSTQQNIVGYIAVTYPRNFDFGGADNFYFELASGSVKKYMEITNFNDRGTQPLLYDITNGRIYRSVQSPGSTPLKYHVLSGNTTMRFFLRADVATTYINVNSITPIDFQDFSNPSNQGEYVIISHQRLFNDGNGNNRVEEYRKYREEKFFQPQIVDIETLYDQFGYGIQKSPLAIRNFIRYAESTWATELTHVFIIGKGREAPSVRNSATARNQCLVPTLGYPGSDILLAADRFNDTAHVSIGRLAAENPDQVLSYLNKIKGYEDQQAPFDNDQAIPPKIWQKEILHFSGGTTASEKAQFKAYLQNYQRVAEDTSWGVHTSVYSKVTDDLLDQSQAQIIRNRINQGVSWITFFGHSATSAFDFSIDEPQNYTNIDRYPIILSNGCFAGFIHDVSTGYSEDFVFQPNAGAIAFIATTSLSTASALNAYSDTFYDVFCRVRYNHTLGTGMRAAYNGIVQKYYNSDSYLGVAYEMTLHGDPGIKPNQYEMPDYAIDAGSVYFTPSLILPGIDSFEVNVVVTNLGRAIKDSINVTLSRTYPGIQQGPDFYLKRVKAPYYRDTVMFKVPVNVSSLGYGQNEFSPYVEAERRIDEEAEGNNGLDQPVTIYISNDDIIPIYPYEFAIVPQQGVTLKASTVNPFAPLRTYQFQIDTSELFLHPLDSGRVTQVGGVVRFTPSINYKDSTVYYWRVGHDTANGTWHYSSFIYINGEYPGWNQSHYFQYLKDDYLNMSLDNDRVFRFPPSNNTIHVKTGKALDVGGNIDRATLGWDYNSVNMHAYRMGGCGFLRGLTFAVIDSLTGTPWTSKNFNGDNYGDQFGNYHCSDKYFLQYGFDFSTTDTNGLLNVSWAEAIKRFINSIPCGSFVLIYSTNDPPYTQWDTILVDALSSLGMPAMLFKTGSINGPFTYFTQKCVPGFNSFFDYKLSGYSVPVDTSFEFFAPWKRGQFSSPPIGPAVEWGSVHWNPQPLNGQFTDRDTLEVIGIESSGIETVLLTTLQPDNFITNISATQYPYLRLRLRTQDDSLRTPTQLQYWRVLYKKPPEAAINPAAHFKVSDSLQLGQSFHVEIALENVTDVPMDSMLVLYTVRPAGGGFDTFYVRDANLPGFDTMILAYDVPLTGTAFTGLNKLIIEANPNNDQIEQYHFNNIAEVQFRGVADNINPLLDVTFDNQHILDGDIVSAKPNILVTLRDENKYLALDDPSLVDVYLKYPGESTPRKMTYDNVVMTFYPADSTNLSRSNKAQIELKPTLDIDGTYELLIHDRDRSGNNSSTVDNRYEGTTFFDYKISFEVINKPMVTNVLNYPNPFTTATKFLFTITGSEVPDFMKIRIMTVKGTVVKEIFKEELGALHVGRNMTEYTWDGRDQYGDLLANGVYFYDVVTRLDDKQMDHMSQSYDKYFKKGFGKLVIVR